MYEHNGREVLRLRQPPPLLGREPRELGARPRGVREGWIECFHAYMGLGPSETHWTLEKFQKYSVEDFEKDVFREGDVDVGLLQSTYLKEWYAKGFNDIEQNAALLERFPGRLIVNGRFDPREGEAGLRQLEKDHRGTASRASSSIPPSGSTARAAGS